jgi:hypothetical protein
MLIYEKFPAEIRFELLKLIGDLDHAKYYSQVWVPSYHTIFALQEWMSSHFQAILALLQTKSPSTSLGSTI